LPPCFENLPCFEDSEEDDAAMIELEVYAAGVRQPEKMLGLALELDVISNLRYKVDTNHDIVYMEFASDVPSVGTLETIFHKLGLQARFVGQLPQEVNSLKKTQRIF
jgi:hypothetical protein